MQRPQNYYVQQQNRMTHYPQQMMVQQIDGFYPSFQPPQQQQPQQQRHQIILQQGNPQYYEPQTHQPPAQLPTNPQSYPQTFIAFNPNVPTWTPQSKKIISKISCFKK